MKLWGGRFQKSTDKKVDDFNSSIRFDARMYKEDIKGSVAHAKMLGKQGIIDIKESEKIVNGLLEVLSDIEKEEGGFYATIDLEEMYSFRDKCRVLDDIKESYEVIEK